MMRTRTVVLLVCMVLFLGVDDCFSLDDEALLEYHAKVKSDPHDTFKKWNYMDKDPCSWPEVHCIDGKVVTLNLRELSSEEKQSTELGNLRHLRYLQIPLRQVKESNSYGIPIKEEGPSFSNKLAMLKFRKFSLPFGPKNDFSFSSFPGTIYARRKLQESSNLAAIPVRQPQPTPLEFVPVPSAGSGAFSAFPDGSQSPFFEPKSSEPVSVSDSNSSDPIESRSHDETSHGKFNILAIGIPITLILASFLAGIFVWRRHSGPTMIGPWKTGLSGPIQKAFVAGVPKLNRCELEAACEDFSNIIVTYPTCTLYKGTLSSGVEIAVVSPSMSPKDWSKRSEGYFRKKVDTLSRINHKNFTNLLGYCVENDPLPFTRMIVVEYAPNGTLYEHLHVKEFEHLDWNSRMRILMGTAYCLEFLHHEISPPVYLGDLLSKSVYLTDDYAAKLCDRNMWHEIEERKSMGEDSDPSDSAPVDPGCNVYSFGIIMLETISGKLPHSEDQGSILNWATEYLNDKRNFKNLVDPTLNTFKNEELEIVCEVIQECIHGDPKDRPTMKEIAAKLGSGLGITPEAAQPRLSPLWWAELEILSVS